MSSRVYYEGLGGVVTSCFYVEMMFSNPATSALLKGFCLRSNCHMSGWDTMLAFAGNYCAARVRITYCLCSPFEMR